MSIKPGDTFLFQYPDKEFHFHIVVETITSDNKALCVFVSSIKSDRGYDKACMLNAGDAPFIKHPSYAVYDKMRMYDCSWLERMLNEGMIKKKEPLAPSVLKRVVDGAVNSLDDQQYVPEIPQELLGR